MLEQMLEQGKTFGTVGMQWMYFSCKKGMNLESQDLMLLYPPNPYIET